MFECGFHAQSSGDRGLGEAIGIKRPNLIRLCYMRQQSPGLLQVANEAI